MGTTILNWSTYKFGGNVSYFIVNLLAWLEINIRVKKLFLAIKESASNSECELKTRWLVLQLTCQWIQEQFDVIRSVFELPTQLRPSLEIVGAKVGEWGEIWKWLCLFVPTKGKRQRKLFWIFSWRKDSKGRRKCRQKHLTRGRLIQYPVVAVEGEVACLVNRQLEEDNTAIQVGLRVLVLLVGIGPIILKLFYHRINPIIPLSNNINYQLCDFFNTIIQFRTFQFFQASRRQKRLSRRSFFKDDDLMISGVCESFPLSDEQRKFQSYLLTLRCTEWLTKVDVSSWARWIPLHRPQDLQSQFAQLRNGVQSSAEPAQYRSISCPYDSEPRDVWACRRSDVRAW